MKKLVALLLTLVLVSSMAVIPAALADDLGNPEGVTISLWHARSTGKNYDQLVKAVAQFNATNKYGITVEEVFQGGNAETAEATMTAIAGNNAPTMTTLTVLYVTQFATNYVLADMNPYAERDADSFSVDNYLSALLEFSYYDDMLISFPYCRSTAVFYYNKDMFAAAGYDEVPATMEELTEALKVIMAQNEGVDGLCFNNDTWYIDNFLVQLGTSEIDKGGVTMSCLEDGSMLKVLTYWKDWIDAGWCIPPTVTSAATNMREAFYQGKLACFFESSGGMANILSLSAENGINVGVAYLPYLSEGKAAAPAGGTNIAVLASASADEQAAAWEFIKFLASDEQSADNSMSTGYLPITKSSATAEDMVAYWAENPSYKAAFDQLNEIGHDFPFSTYLSEVATAITTVTSQLIIDGTITPEEALNAIQKNASMIEW